MPNKDILELSKYFYYYKVEKHVLQERRNCYQYAYPK